VRVLSRPGKGKVERFNGYLRRSFYVPLASRLGQSGLQLHVVTANVEVSRWLREVANERVHGMTQEKPVGRMEKKVAHLQALARPWPMAGRRRCRAAAGCGSRTTRTASGDRDRTDRRSGAGAAPAGGI
jgi:hypothetical protein